MLERIDGSNTDVNSVWFSDETQFHLNGFVNKQNCQIWGIKNPHVCITESFYCQKVTLWEAVSSRNIVGPFFLWDTVISK